MTRVLVVDDNDENRYYLTRLLEAHGCEVAVARDGAAALASARESPPDVVVSDLLMPVMDGYTMLRRWKADADFRSIPFIVYTATYTDPEDERLALDLGADAFFLKPIEPDDFVARFDAVRAASARATPRSPSSPERGDATLAQYNAALVRKLEDKMIELEAANRQLVRDIAAREAAEAAREVGERRLHALEQQLREAQKMEAIGRVAGGVAHDFNNLLSVILGYTGLLLAEPSCPAPFRDDVEHIQRAAIRGTELTRQLLAFSRRQVMQTRATDVVRLVTDMKALLDRLVGDEVAVELDLVHGRGANVQADPSQLEQIFMNLAVNARDAMPGGGRLRIEVRDVVLESADVAARTDLAPGRQVRIAVSDTGVGMDEATQARIFEPFFTTKERGKGTGLGLSTVFGIVKQSKGHIEVSSRVGEGTSFVIYLPATEDDPVAVEPAPPEPSARGGNETILVVEEDALFRETLCAILRRNGYRVLAASDGEEAVVLSAALTAEIHLLVVDVVVPRTSGAELAARLAATRPRMKVVYLSSNGEGDAHRGIAPLRNPVTPDDLLRRVREVLTAS